SAVFFLSSRRRHTRSKRDWSSDVCSSDLKDKHMDKKQHGCLVFVVALFIYLLLGWVVVKAGVQPVAEAFGYELPTAATLILVFWVQALAAGNVWQGYGKE